MSLKTIQSINAQEYWLQINPDVSPSETLRERLFEEMRQERKQEIKLLGEDFPCYNGGHKLERNKNGHWICSVCCYHSILTDYTHPEEIAPGAHYT